MRFEPSGFTKNPEIPYAKSITDYIFRWLASKFLSQESQQAMGVQTVDNGARAETVTARVETPQPASTPAAPVSAQSQTFRGQADAPSCHYCGSIMTRNGACYRCANCGSTSGCS